MHKYTIYNKKGAKLHKSTHRTIHTSALESKSMKKNCTTPFYFVAASITCSFDRLFHNKKGGQNEKKTRAGLRNHEFNYHGLILLFYILIQQPDTIRYNDTYKSLPPTPWVHSTDQPTPYLLLPCSFRTFMYAMYV